MINLPKKLGKEPVIEVICGAKFESKSLDEPVQLLPGLLLAVLSDKNPKFEVLSAGQLPQVVRDSDPVFQNAPLMQIVTDKFSVLIGNKWLGVNCLTPYMGWKDFSLIIEIVFKALSQASFVTKFTGLSLKYGNFIENPDNTPFFSSFNIEIKVAKESLSRQPFSFKVELNNGSLLHSVSVFSNVKLSKKDVEGLPGALVVINTCSTNDFSPHDFQSQLPNLLEEMHSKNKELFFSLINEKTIQKLEPQYD